MPVLQSSIYAVAIGLCLFGILLVQHGKAELPRRFFIAFLAVQGLRFVFEWMMVHPDLPMTTLWLFGVMTLSLIMSPLAWAFAQDLTDNALKMSVKRLAPHGSVVLIGVLLLLPLFTTLFPDHSLAQTRWPSQSSHSLVHVTMLLMAGVFLLQSVYYIRRCWQLFEERVEQNKGLFTEVSDLGSNTLRILVIAVLTNCAVSVLRVVYCWALDDIPVLNITLAALQTASLVYVAYAVLQQAFANNADLKQERKTLFKHNTVKAKYQNSGLSAERAQGILSHLADLLHTEQIHLRSDINLALLCERLDESPQDVSQAINQSKYQNFYQMIHRHRIVDAQAILLKRPELTVLEVAYEVGYNSKSTFNTAFKKFTACSPSEYRKRAEHKPTAKQLPA